MKKKGFTLIELLAVIVILAIIALIAVPMVLNIIEKSKVGALKSSLTGLIESADMYYANNQLKGENSSETIFDFEEGEQISTEQLSYKGKVENGKLILHANGEVAACIDDGTHYAYKNKDDNEVTTGLGTCLYDGTTGDFSSNSSITDLRGKVIEATIIEENDDNALITIPLEGHYDGTSKISIPIETIKNEVEQLSYQLVHTFAQDTASKSDNPIQLTDLTHKEYLVLISAVAGPYGNSTLSKTDSALITSVTGGTYTEIGSSYRIINTNYASGVSRIYLVTLDDNTTSLTVNHTGNYSIVIAV